MAARETVLLVHGTFSNRDPEAAAAATESKWYEPGSDACRRLDEELERRGSVARCWAHLGADEKRNRACFRWDGQNSWLSRLDASTQLRAELRRLAKENWIVHLVAHSHGGNIVIDAVTDAGREVETAFRGRIALLGTPVYGNAWGFGRELALWRFAWVVAALAGWGAVLWLLASTYDTSAALALSSSWNQIAGLTIIAAVLFAGIFLARAALWAWRGPAAPEDHVRARELPGRPGEIMHGSMRKSPQFLLIGSAADEAWRALAPLPEGTNPLTQSLSGVGGRIAAGARPLVQAASERALSRVRWALRETRLAPMLIIGLLLLALVAVVRWAPAWPVLQSLAPDARGMAFLAALAALTAASAIAPRLAAQALLFPVVVATLVPSAVVAVFGGLVRLTLEGRLRAFVWNFLRSMMLGVGGGPRGPSDIRLERHLPAAFAADGFYLELPKATVDKILSEQQKCINVAHRDLMDPALFTSWAAEDVLKLLERLELPLVHNAYQADALCLETIAAWIAEPVYAFSVKPRIHDVIETVGTSSRFAHGYKRKLEQESDYDFNRRKLLERIAPERSWWPEVANTAMSPFAIPNKSSGIARWAPRNDARATQEGRRLSEREDVTRTKEKLFQPYRDRRLSPPPG